MPIITVEGPRDALVWIRDSFPSTAILGSKVFSKEKARILSNLGRPIILFFDGDLAGIQATNLVSSTLKEVLGSSYSSRVFIYKLVQRAMKILDLTKEEVLDLKLDPANLPDEVRRDFIKFYKRVQNK
jgi:DNA primase